MTSCPLRLVACAIALAAIALTPSNSGAQPRDPASESLQIHRFSRNFTSPTRAELASLQYLLTADEFLDLMALHNEASCLRWMEQFWWARDPIPTTPENEARAEHERRVELATTWFGRMDWPGFDQRGEVCIRYGLPAGRDEVEADVDVKGYSRPGEYWFYPALGMTVHFEDAYGKGEYTYLIEHVDLPTYERFSSDRLRMPSGEWKTVPDMDLDLMTLDWTRGIDGGHFGIYNPSDQFTNADFNRSLRQFPEVLEKYPVVYPFNYSTMRVPFDFDVALFRGGDSVDRVDVNAEFTPGAGKGPNLGKREYRATAVFFDSQAKEVARLSHSTMVANPSAAAESLFTMVMQLPFTLSPAPYLLAITLEEPATGRFTSMRKSVTAEDFERRLSLSTVCFSSNITPATRPTAFTRGALEVVPKPSARYSVATSVPVYFEVYNLSSDDQGAFRYTVSYRVIPGTPAPRGLWKKLTGTSGDDSASLASSFESIAKGTHDVVYLFVKTDHLWPGDYELDVTVVDEMSKKETNRRATFHLVE